MNHCQTAPSSLAEWLAWLECLHIKPIELGLERIGKVAAAIALLNPAPVVFTVTGTNGKGTTCCVLESILLAAGLRVGVYSSPHLLNYTERVRIQGQVLSEAAHCQAFAHIEAGRDTVSLTYFEFGTLAALYLFKQAQLDVVILEVGMGGRLDATNIIDPDVAAITSIALDHIEWLGVDRASIGREKAGIFRASKPAIVGEADIPQTVSEVAKQLGAPLYGRDDSWFFERHNDTWCWQSGATHLTLLPVPAVPLQNAATALAVLHYSSLTVSEAAIRQGLASARLPGRFQIVRQYPLLILDVAHNPHAACYLADRLSQLPDFYGKIYAVIGMLADKDIEGTLAYLSVQVDEWYCTSLQVPRGASAQVLARHLAGARLFDDVESAWRQAMQDARREDAVVVCGSFHTVAPVMAAVESWTWEG